jgi:two-component sensor histidine kinase
VKYGALSVPDGKVTMQWDIEPAKDGVHLVWRWLERNGPSIMPPAKHGFGLTLIERSLKHELKGGICSSPIFCSPPGSGFSVT